MITTVIPTFERPTMLRRAIESSLAQDIPGLEVHVHDNASSDETPTVVDEYVSRDPRVKYFRNPENIGAARNIVKGLGAVTTKYYSLLSDDDFLLPGFYAKALKAFEENPASAMVCAKTLTVDVINKKVEFRNRDWQAGFFQPCLEVSRKMYGSHFVTTSVVFSSEVKTKLGPFDPSGSDSLYMTVVAAAFPFSVLDFYGAAVVLHDQAYSMIGEGISKERLPVLYGHLTKTLKLVMDSDFSDEMKVYLTMQVMNSYHQMFDTKRLKGVLFGTQEPLLGQLLLMPSFINNRGLVVKLHQSVPGPLKGVVKFLYQQFTRFNQARVRSNMAGGRVAIPTDTLDLLTRYEPDVSLLKFHPPTSKNP